MIYHFLSGSPYSKKFIDFMIDNKQHFDLDDHFFIINRSDVLNVPWDQEQLKKVKHCSVATKFGFIPVLNKISKNDKLLIHGLFNPRLLIYLYLNRKMIKRCVWSIWGGDLYFYKNRENNLKHGFIEHLRKTIIPRIPVITSLVKGDYDLVKKIYGSTAKYIYSFYPNPVDFSIVDRSQDKGDRSNKRTIMIGNSGDPSNNHEEVFEILARFKKENIKIICPLSYGESDYISRTINRGKEIFGEKFEPITEFLSPEEYVKVISGVDVVIMNHDRQQALGNIILLLSMGKKIYLNEDTTHYRFFSENNIKISKVKDIVNSDLADLFVALGDALSNNAKLTRELFSNKNYVSMWKQVFGE